MQSTTRNGFLGLAFGAAAWLVLGRKTPAKDGRFRFTPKLARTGAVRVVTTGAPESRDVTGATGARTSRERGIVVAGRIGLRQGQVSELCVFLPFVKGGAQRLRSFLQVLEGNFRAADAVGTVHDMRFVFVDNDTKLLFATAYDGDFDAYIEDFAAKIPNAMDLWLSNCEGYPGMRNPSAAKDWIASHQIAATTPSAPP